MDHLCYFCLVVVMLSFIGALWSPAGKGLTSWLSFVMSNCEVVTFPCGILGQVWCLIVSILDLCPPSYLNAFYWRQIFALGSVNVKTQNCLARMEAS